MSDQEKQPLILSDPSTSPPSTLSALSSRVDETRTNLQTAHREHLSAQQDYQRAWANTPRGRAFRIAFWGFFVFIIALPLSGILYLGLTDDDEPGEYLPRRVPLEAHIMSKCPDARDCLHDLVLPAMVNVSQYVDFKLSYIGTPTDHDDGISCKHGAPECLGNIIELCAAHVYPNPKIYLGFTMCLSNNYSDIPSRDLVEECALEHGMDFGRINACVSADDGEKGVQMLRDSVKRSSEVGVSRSCTVRVDGREWCVRDGGEWKECEGGSEAKDLVDEILERRWVPKEQRV